MAKVATNFQTALLRYTKHIYKTFVKQYLTKLKLVSGEVKPHFKIKTTNQLAGDGFSKEVKTVNNIDELMYTSENPIKSPIT